MIRVPSVSVARIPGASCLPREWGALGGGVGREGCLWWVPGLQLGAVQVPGHPIPWPLSANMRMAPSSSSSASPKQQGPHCQGQLADSALYLVCVLGSFGDFGSCQGGVFSSWAAELGQSSYLGTWAQTCTKGKALSYSHEGSSVATGCLALSWAQWAERIREHTLPPGFHVWHTCKTLIVPSTGRC